MRHACIGLDARLGSSSYLRGLCKSAEKTFYSNIQAEADRYRSSPPLRKFAQGQFQQIRLQDSLTAIQPEKAEPGSDDHRSETLGSDAHVCR